MKNPKDLEQALRAALSSSITQEVFGSFSAFIPSEIKPDLYYITTWFSIGERAKAITIEVELTDNPQKDLNTILDRLLQETFKFGVWILNFNKVTGIEKLKVKYTLRRMYDMLVDR